MSDHDDDYDDDTTDQDDGSRNPLRQQLKRQEKELKALRDQLAEGQKATRELAFVKAGVDSQDKKAAYFIKAYDGELTPDAIKAAALDAGFLETKSENVVTAEENAALDEIDRGNGGLPAGKAADLETQMRALYGRKDLSPAEQKAQFDALAAQAGLMPAG